jgi:hypothetical protein
MGKLKSNQKEVLQKVFKAMQAMDMYEYDTFEIAISNLFKNLARDLNHTVEIYERFNFEISASIVSLADRKLEEKNKEFLEKLVQYIDGVDRAFNKRAVELARVCQKKYEIKIITPEVEKERMGLLFEIVRQQESFTAAIAKVNKFSQKQLVEVRRRNILHLEKYDYQFKQLALFEKLDLETAIDLIAKKAKIST